MLSNGFNLDDNKYRLTSAYKVKSVDEVGKRQILSKRNVPITISQLKFTTEIKKNMAYYLKFGFVIDS